MHHNNWLTIGEIINLIKKPIASYADQVVKGFHVKLSHNLARFGKCTTPGDCLKKKKPHDLCHSCKGWYQELASSHRNTNKPQIKWRQNCDTSKWPDDAWEVAKFFMSTLGNNKTTVKDADSTYLSSLLNVLEWMSDVAFGGARRVDVNLVEHLRSKVRNGWAHAPKQEMTDQKLNNAFQIATKFLDDLNKVVSIKEVKKCIEDIQFLKANGLTNVIEAELNNLLLLRQELCGDVTKMKEEIKSLKEDQNSEKEAIQEHEIKLKSLEDFREECRLRMEDFQKWKESQEAKNIQETEQSIPKSCLPEKLATFTARDTEVGKIMSFLEEKGSGIVSIVGGPGFGKSAIAVEVSHRLSEQHGIPVNFLYLSTVSTIDEVIYRLCHDVRVYPGEDPKSSLISWLRNIKEKVVLVMDNIEQLLEDEEKRSKFNDLMRLLHNNSEQRLQIITTSRAVFSIADLSTKMISVNEMDSDSSMELLRKFSRNEKMDDVYFHEMANLCGHVPLALCIAASRIQDFEDPNELITYLKEQPMEVLKAPESNQYVQKTIKMSFQMLSNEDEKSFVRLSLFDGNFDRDAAKEIIDRNKLATQDFLKNLISHSLLQRSDGRYSIHLLIKRFLTDYDQFEEEMGKAQELMVEYFLKKCHSLTLKSYSKDGFNDARESLKKDAHNVEEILKVCQAQTQTSNIIECLARSDIYKSSSRFFYNFVRNVLPQKVIKDFLQYCVELAKNRNQLAISMNFQCILADQEGHRSRWNESSEYVKRMEKIKKEFDANEEVFKIDNALLSYYFYSYGRYLFNTAKKAAPPSRPDLLRQADDYLQKSLGLRHDQAQLPLEKVDEGISIIQLGRIRKACAVIEHHNKNTEKRESEMEKARSNFQKALALTKDLLGDHELTSTCHKVLGDLFLRWRKNDLALASYEDALELREKLLINSSESMAYLLRNYGWSLFYLRRFDESVKQLNKARNIAEKLAEQNEPTFCKANVYYELAKLFNCWKPCCQEAVSYARKAIEMSDFLSKIDLAKMEIIVEKGEKTPSK